MHLGYKSDIAVNAEQALKILDKTAYDLVLSDGILQQKIRQKQDKSPDIVAIAIRANAIKEDLDKCLDTGMHDYLTKHIRALELQAVLLHWEGVIMEKKRILPNNFGKS